MHSDSSLCQHSCIVSETAAAQLERSATGPYGCKIHHRKPDLHFVNVNCVSVKFLDTGLQQAWWPRCRAGRLARMHRHLWRCRVVSSWCTTWLGSEAELYSHLQSELQHGAEWTS